MFRFPMQRRYFAVKAGTNPGRPLTGTKVARRTGGNASGIDRVIHPHPTR